MSAEHASTTGQKGLLQLHAALNPDGQSTATLKVEWCATRELVDEIERRGFTDAYVLLVVRSRTNLPVFDDLELGDYVETKRYLTRLSDGACYVSFSRPGRNEVYAVLLDLENYKAHQAAQKLIRSTDSVLAKIPSYRTDVYAEHARINLIQLGSVMTVHVPREMFAPDPPEWARRFVSNFFETSAFDQCHFRRRFLLSALVFAPLLLTFGTLVSLGMVALALLLGLRNIQWDGLHPFANEFPWPEGQLTSIYVHDRDGNRRQFWFAFVVVNPVTLVVPATLVYLVAHRSPTVGGWLNALFNVDVLLIIMALTYAATVLTGLVIAAGWHAVFDVPARREQQRENRLRREEAERRAYLAQVRALVCDTPEDGQSSEARPAPNHTLSLQFKELKAKICRPYSS